MTTETNVEALKQELNMYMACQVAIGDIRIPARECIQAKAILDFLEGKILPLQAQVTALAPPIEEAKPPPPVGTERPAGAPLDG